MRHAPRVSNLRRRRPINCSAIRNAQERPEQEHNGSVEDELTDRRGHGHELWGLTLDMSGGPKGAKRPLERPLDGGVRPRGPRNDSCSSSEPAMDVRFAEKELLS